MAANRDEDTLHRPHASMVDVASSVTSTTSSSSSSASDGDGDGEGGGGDDDGGNKNTVTLHRVSADTLHRTSAHSGGGASGRHGSSSQALDNLLHRYEDEDLATEEPGFSKVDVERPVGEIDVTTSMGNLRAIDDVAAATAVFHDHDVSTEFFKDENQRTTDYHGEAMGAPDGGYGWLIVFASFIAHSIADGISFSIGIFYAHWIEFFEASLYETAWVSSLFVSVPLMMGPCASWLTNKYGCRCTSIMGGVVAALGFLGGACSCTLTQLAVSVGLVSGAGLSLVYVPAVVIVAQYFEKKRAFATGLAVAGSGIGTTVFAPFMQVLIERFGWQGALLILSGVLLNLVVCGLLFRPIDDAAGYQTPLTSEVNTSISSVGTLEKSGKEEKKHLIDDLSSHNSVPTVKYIPSHAPNPAHKTPNAPRPSSLFIRSTFNAHSLTALPTFDVDGKPKTENRTSCPPPGGAVYGEVIARPLARRDVFYRGSLSKAQPRDWSSCPDVSRRAISTTGGDDSREVRAKGAGLGSQATPRSGSSRRRSGFAVFAYFCLSNVLLYAAYDIPYLYTPVYWISVNSRFTSSAHSMDPVATSNYTIKMATTDSENMRHLVENQAASLVSYIGFASTFGQVIIGYIGDRSYVDCTRFYACLTVLAGLCCACTTLTRSYLQLTAGCLAYGVFISANYSLTTIIIVDVLGMSRLTSAYGVLMLSQGLANLVGPPLAGLLTDQYSGVYDATFYTAGAVIVVSGLMLIPLKRFTERFKYHDSFEQITKNLHPSW